jgi:hypothetical protein
VFIHDIRIGEIKLKLTMRVRGIERLLKKRGPFGLMLNIGSNFADISNAEFTF